MGSSALVKMGARNAHCLVLFLLCFHRYGAVPVIESTTQGKQITTTGKLEAKAGGVSVRFGAYEGNNGDQLTFPGISNRAFGGGSSHSSSSPSSSASSVSSSVASSQNKAGESGGHYVTRPAQPQELHQAPPSVSSPCGTCCTSNPCSSYPPSGGSYNQGGYQPPPPPPYGGIDDYFPQYPSNPYPGYNAAGSGSYSGSQASSFSGFPGFGGGYHQGRRPIHHPGGNFGQNNLGGGNYIYPSRPVGGSSASSLSSSYADNLSYQGNSGYPVGGSGFDRPFSGGYLGSQSGSFSSATSSSSSGKGGSYSSSASQSGSSSGIPSRPVRPVRPEPEPGFNLPDGMCRSSGC